MQHDRAIFGIHPTVQEFVKRSMGTSVATVIVKRIFLAMGTQVSITLALEDQRQRRAAEGAIDEVERSIEQFGRDAWAWGTGKLAQFNRELMAGARVAVPKDLRTLFRLAWRARENTGGLYEPRIAALVQLWGFDDVTRLGSAPPPSAQVEALLAALKSAPDFDGTDQYGPAPQVGWDFGGIGKGYIVDLALDALQARGYGNAIVDAGGNLAARGRRGDRPWRIGIRDPRVPAELGVLLASMDVHNETVSTHGDDQRCFVYQGRRYAHILDPRRGEPVEDLRALTVVHAEGCVAEAEGAALFVAGAAAWRAASRQFGITEVLVMTAADQIQATASLAARLQAMPGVTIAAID